MHQSFPLVQAPDFKKQFKLASDVGTGSVLQQEDNKGIDHSVCYFSNKFVEHQQRYSAIKREALSLLLAVQHFNVYLNTTSCQC